MAWRKTATFHAPIEVLVLTCDVCACDIGHEDERRPRAHFQLSRHPNPGAIDDQEPAVVICSRECLRAFVANVSGPDRAPPMPPPSVVGKKKGPLGRNLALGCGLACFAKGPRPWARDDRRAQLQGAPA